MPEFLPISRADMTRRGWDQCDFVYIIGDGYVDHPSFGHAIISRVLEDAGYEAFLEDWRRENQRRRQALERGEKVAIVFGPEDRGLDNDAIQHCQRLVTIPTNPEASSLNLAQSVLLLLYECAKAVRARQHEAAGEKAPAEGGSGRVISSADYERLLDNLKDMLLRLDCLHGDNPDYFLMPWRRLLARAQVRRHEYDALMGLCRQVRNKLDGGNKA